MQNSPISTVCSSCKLIGNLFVHIMWGLLRYLSFVFVFAYFINYLIVPKTIKHMAHVYTPFPILNGLEMMIPKIKRAEDSFCLQFYRFSKIYGDVYQIHIGTRLIVVANSFDSIKELWASKNVKGNNSRPLGYSFHKVLSKGVYTIGTTPAGESYKNARKNISENVLCEKRNNDFNYVFMNKFCDLMIDRLIHNSSDKVLISNSILRETQYFHLAVALWLTYGFEFNPEDPAHKILADKIIVVENKITKVRSHVQNSVDYLPFLLRKIISLFSSKNEEFNELYIAREQYLELFCSYSKKLYNDIKTGLIFQSYKDHEMAINDVEDLKQTLMYTYFNDFNKRITYEEITSECLTMVSAGLDNTPLNFKYGLHQLANYHPEIWEQAYSELMNSYDGNYMKAYDECGATMKCEYIKAIVQETLRLFTVLPMALPRETTSDIYYKDSIIPKGTTLFLNCWAGNHDKKKFPDPMKFVPERWLITIVNDKMEKQYSIDSNIKHLAFGIGCRMCLGYNFAFRELYILFSKIILKFEPARKTSGSHIPSDNPLELNMYPESLAIEPIDFEIHLKVRNQYELIVSG